MIKRFIKVLGEKKKENSNKSCCESEIKEAVAEQKCCTQAGDKK